MPPGFDRGAPAHDVRPEPRQHASVRYPPLPTTPSAEVDIALLVHDGTTARRVESEAVIARPTA